MSTDVNALFDNFLGDILKHHGPDGVAECFQFLLGAFVITHDGVIVGANNKFLSLVELTKKELYGTRAIDLVTEDEQDRLLARFQHDDTVRYELKLFTKSKTIRHVVVSPRVFYAAGKKYRIAEFVDITEKKLEDQMLYESEQKFRSIFDQAAVGIARVSPEGQFLEVNQKLCDIVEYTHLELMKKTFQDITHPDDLDTDLSYVEKMLRKEISTYTLEKRYLTKSDNIVWINLTASLVSDQDGIPHYFVSIIEDITARKKAENDLRVQATLDSLTNLHNRHSLTIEIDKELNRAKRYKSPLSFLMIDIDHFKAVNDTYGHLAGDTVLKELADIFKLETRSSDCCGRFGGEEFLIIMPELDTKAALHLADRIRKKTESHTIIFQGEEINITLSIGVSSYPDHGSEADTLIIACDDAMYTAKANGRNQVFPAT